MSWLYVGAQVKDGSHVVIRTACKRTHNQYETSWRFRPIYGNAYTLAAALSALLYRLITSTGLQDEPASVFSMVFHLSILSTLLLQCLWKDKDGSIITPNILGVRSSGTGVSSKVIYGCTWDWCVCGVNSVTVDFGADIRREFSFR